MFALKHNPNGTIERYKVRLVPKGLTLAYGVDYFETISQVAKLNSIIVIMSSATNLSWLLYQKDVKNFLQLDLKGRNIYGSPTRLYKNRTGRQNFSQLEMFISAEALTSGMVSVVQ